MAKRAGTVVWHAWMVPDRDYMTEMPWPRIGGLWAGGAGAFLVVLTVWAAAVVHSDRQAKAESERPPRWTDENRFDTRPC